MEWTLLLGLALVGLVAGLVSALFGIGGGLVMVPILHYVGGVEFQHATALSLLVIAVQAPTGVWQHARRGAVDWRLAWPMIVSGTLGVAIGVVIEPYAPVPGLKLLLALLMLLAAWRLVGKLPQAAPGERPGLPFMLGLGLVAGVVSKLLGIGGGLLTVPVLALTGVEVHLAVGSSLAPVFTNAAFASAEALGEGFDWTMAVPMAIGALVGVPIGAAAAHRLDARRLSRVFAGGLVVAALYIGLTSGAW